MSINWQEHYQQRKNRQPSPLLIQALKYVRNKRTALDLGSGDLVDASFLLSQGFNQVIAIDKELPPKNLLENISKDQFKFIQSSFDQFEFPVQKYDLINAHFALPFNGPNTFNQIWSSIAKSLATDGVFVGQFLGLKDEWNDKKRDMTFHDITDVKDLFREMKILEFKEEEIDRKLASGANKHWHLFHVIAQKL